MTGKPLSVFWRVGLLAVALVLLSTLVIHIYGPQSAVALVVLPLFFVLFQVPYVLVASLSESHGVFRPLFFGSLWVVIPFWGLLVFLWNGALAALLSVAYARLTKGA